MAFVGGYLGGHLSLVRKIGTAHPAFGVEDVVLGNAVRDGDGAAPANGSLEPRTTAAAGHGT